MIPRTVLVTGATGKVGRHLVAGLLDRGADVRALVRRPVTAALPREVRLVEGDLRRPETVAAAAAGADAAFLLWPGFSAQGAAEVVEALARRVEHLVYLSAARLQDDDAGPAQGVWADVERLVERSGVGWTFLRAGGFAANTLEWAGQIRAGDVVRIPYLAAGRSLIHERDIAEVATRVLMEGAPKGRAFAVTGPEVLTQAEQLRTIGEAIDRPLRAEELPPQAARRALEHGMGEHAEAALAYWSTLVDEPERVTDDIARLTGHRARSFAEWARDHVEDFAAASTGDVARGYADAFRAGRVEQALRLLSPDLVRVAPLEAGGAELHGLAAVLQNTERQNEGIELHAVEVGEPLLDGDRFALRFAFDQTVRATGARQATTKLSLYTVDAGRIVREEVFYLTDPVSTATARG